MTVYSPNLNIPHLDANAASPEVPVDGAIDAFDAKITGTVVVAFGSNSASLTQDQQAAGSIFHLTVGSPGPSGACTLNFAAFGIGNFTVINDTGQTVSLQISGQPLSVPTIADGKTQSYCCDGVNVRPLGSSLGDPTRHDLAMNFSGAPSNGQKFTFIAGRAFSLPASLTGSKAVIGTNPTLTLTINLYKNGGGIGSVQFSTGGVATLTFASTVSFSPGDVLTAICPNPADATAADIAITILGTLT